MPFVATLLPIFLRLTIADVPVAAFVSEDGQLGVLVGCALGSLILMVVPQRRFEHAVALLALPPFAWGILSRGSCPTPCFKSSAAFCSAWAWRF